MSRPRRPPLVLAALALALGCGDPGPAASTDDDASSSGSTTGDDGWPGPISTVTGATSGATTTLSGGSGSGEGGDTDEGDPTGPAADEAPTIELLVDGSDAPVMITRAQTLSVTASVADDRGLVRVELHLDDDPTPLAEVDLTGATAELVELPLPILDAETNGSHKLRAVVHDDAMQATESAPLGLTLALPKGGSPVWSSVSTSKFASKALAVAVDSIGDVIAVGSQDTDPNGERSRMMIRKYNGETGEMIWQREVPTQSEVPTPLGSNVARGVAVDAYDNVYVVGEVRPDGKSRSLWLGKYTFDGLQAASHTSEAPQSRGNAVVATEDRVFVVGYRYDAQYVNVATVDAYDAGLKPLWGHLVTIGDTLDARFYGAALDRNGDLVVAGSSTVDQTNVHGLMGLYTPSGVPLWSKLIASTWPQPHERLFSVVVTDDNEYVGVGRIAAIEDPRRYWLVRMADDGAQLQSEPEIFLRCGDPQFDDDTDVCGVAQGPLGRLAMAGVGLWKSDDFQIQETKANWWVHLWEPSSDGPDGATDRGLAVATDADGFVSAAGYQTGLGAPRWWVMRRNP
ncbi:MAG: hypothetical protein R3B09_05055 [Nannocystaceae bacterium]